MPQHSPDPTGFAGPADLAACRALLSQGSRTFHAASLLLPEAVREPASALYAFCRLADDAVDLRGGRADAVERLRDRLDRAYAGRPLPIPADRAFADAALGHGIPRALPEALFEGFAWDAAGRAYEDLEGLLAYAARVAGTVGAMMAVLMGVRDRCVVARACDLGVAMQLSNVARDVGEDARAGRLYLPRAWLREAGVDPPAFLARPAFDGALGAVVERLLAAAAGLYARAAGGIAGLPLDCRPGIHAARLLYADIGREVARRGFDSVSGRAVVASHRQAWLLGRAAVAAALGAPGEPAPPLEATRFLVEAVTAAPPMPPAAGRVAARWWDLDERAGWAIELFQRLERREQGAGRPGGP